MTPSVRFSKPKSWPPAFLVFDSILAWPIFANVNSSPPPLTSATSSPPTLPTPGALPQGRLPLHDGRFTRRHPSFEPIQDAEKDDLEFLFMLGTSYGMVKRADDSRRVFERLVAAGGDTPHLHLLLGKAYLAPGPDSSLPNPNFAAPPKTTLCLTPITISPCFINRRAATDQAISQWDKEIAAFPENTWAYKELAEIRMDGGNIPAAIALLEQGAVRNPDSPDLLKVLARAYLQSSDPARAIPFLKRALALDPEDGSTHFLLGRAYQASSHPQEAQSEMAKARTLMKANSEGKMGALSRDRAEDSPFAEHQ